MKIIKAKITKDSTLVATYKDENGTTTVEGKNLVTSDLINAFSKLNPHAALLTEQKEVDGIESVDEVPDIIGQVLDVTGYSIGGDGDHEGVTLIAKRFLKTGKVLNLCAPFTMFNNENESYINAFELEQEIQSCEFEVKEYLFNKKWRIVQQELPFEEDTANADVQPDAIPEAGTDFNQEVAEFQQAMNDAGVDIIMSERKLNHVNHVKSNNLHHDTAVPILRNYYPQLLQTSLPIPSKISGASQTDSKCKTEYPGSLYR